MWFGNGGYSVVFLWSQGRADGGHVPRSANWQRVADVYIASRMTANAARRTIPTPTIASTEP